MNRIVKEKRAGMMVVERYVVNVLMGIFVRMTTVYVFPIAKEKRVEVMCVEVMAEHVLMVKNVRL